MTPKQHLQRGRWLVAALQKERVARAIELIRQGTDLSVRDPDGSTALYTALAHGCVAVVRPLLEAGANPNVPGSYGTYPVHVAAEYGGADAPQLLETLIAHGARLDVRDEEGATAVFLAGKSASAETVHTLQRHGANISDRNNQLDTSLTFVCCWGMTERAAMLLDAGIDLEAQDDAGMTALHWAAKNGHAGTVNLLLSIGARVNVADRWGNTPLIYAAAHGSLRCVTSLLEAGADPVVRDENGQTALDAARRYSGRDLADAMLADAALSNSLAACEGKMYVERFRTADGEPAVQISMDRPDWGYGAGWTRENCDSYDAIVQLLQHYPFGTGSD